MGLLPDGELPQEERGELTQITGDIYWQNKFTNFYWYAGAALLIVPPAGIFFLAFLATACIVTNPDQPDRHSSTASSPSPQTAVSDDSPDDGSDDSPDDGSEAKDLAPWRAMLSVFVAMVLLWGAAFVARPLDRLPLAVPAVLVVPPVRRRVVAWIEAETGQKLPVAVRGAAVVVYGVLTVAAILLMGGQAAEQNVGLWSTVESWGLMVAFAALLAFLAVRVVQSAQEEADDEETDQAAS